MRAVHSCSNWFYYLLLQILILYLRIWTDLLFHGRAYIDGMSVGTVFPILFMRVMESAQVQGKAGEF